MPHPFTLRTSRHILGAVALICALVMSATAMGQSPPDQPETSLDVHILGNYLLLDPVLERAVADVIDSADPPEATAQLAEAAGQRLRTYLDETGFEMARVEAVAYDGDLWLFVDEGRLERVFFAGAGTVQTARMQVELELPEDIYNRSYLERELERLRAKHDVRRVEADLVVEPDERDAQTPHLRRRLIAAVQSDVDEAEAIWREAGGRYSLRVTVVGEEWGRGFDFGASLIGPYGLEGSAGYSDTDLFFFADRYSVDIALGGLSDHLFTHAEAGLFYATPELLDESVRPAVNLDASLENLERDSLELDSYLYLQSDMVFFVGFEPRTNLVVSPGLGFGYDDMLSLERGEETPGFVVEQARTFLVGEIGFEWLISRIGFRRDELHLFEAVVQMRSVDEGLWNRIEGDYQKAWAIGAHDLFFRSSFFSFLGGGIEWYDEDPIASQVIRAVPGDHDFARNLLAAGSEFRLSIHEDLVKAGLSASGAAARLHERQTRDEFLAYYASGGPGLHIQLLDNFQLNLFYHVAWRDDGATDGRFSLKFWKVY